MKKEYKFTGGNGTSIVTINEDKITIERKGFISHTLKPFAGIKSIRINQITGTQYKPCKFFNGFLQFLIMGSQEVKGGLDTATKDENSVVWSHKNQNVFAEEIIDYIDNFNNQEKNVSVEKDDIYDKLIKLKHLLDSGLITKEEFETQKNKLLK